MSIASASDSESIMTRRDLSGYPSHLSLDAFLKLESVFLNMEHEQGYRSICSLGNDQRGWIKEGD